jgi:hypothetical protein
MEGCPWIYDESGWPLDLQWHAPPAPTSASSAPEPSAPGADAAQAHVVGTVTDQSRPCRVPSGYTRDSG